MAQKDFGPTSDLGPTGQSVHTEIYNPAPNNNQCDMGIIHSYRFVNTEGMYGMLSGSKAYTVDVGDFPLDFYLNFCPRQEDPEGHTNYFYNNVNIHFTNINEGATVHTLNFTPRPNNEFCDMGESHRYRNVNTLYMYRVNTTYQTTLIKTYDVGNNITASDPLLYFVVFNQGIEGKHLEDLNGEIPYALEIEFTNLPTYKSGYISDIALPSGSTFQINAKDYFPSTFNIVATAAEHTLEYPAYQYPNQVIDLTAQHSYRNINTVGLYRNNEGADEDVLDIGYFMRSVHPGNNYMLYNASTIAYGGKTFYSSLNFNFQNVPPVPTGTCDAYLTPNQQIYLYNETAHTIPLYANLKNLYRNNLGKLDVSYDVGARSASGYYWGYSNSLTISGGSFYNSVNVYTYNYPAIVVHTDTYTPSSFNRIIDLGASHTVRNIDLSGCYKNGGSFLDILVNCNPVSTNNSTCCEIATYSSDIVRLTFNFDPAKHSDGTGRMIYNRARFFISPGAAPINYISRTAFPLLLSKQRTTASGFNNMVVIPNANLGINGGCFVHFPGTGYSNGLSCGYISGGIYNGAYVNSIFNFSKDSQSSLSEGSSMFIAGAVNTSSYLYTLIFKYAGWYKIEVTIGSSNAPGTCNQIVNIYKVDNHQHVLANGNHDAISTSYCNRLLTVYGNSAYLINNTGSWPQVSGMGYGYVYVYMNEQECLVGRMNGADSATRVSTFQLGLCYNSARLILR